MKEFYGWDEAYEDQAIEVRCPHCNAAKGHTCRRPNGRYADKPHRTRIEKAKTRGGSR